MALSSPSLGLQSSPRSDSVKRPLAELEADFDFEDAIDAAAHPAKRQAVEVPAAPDTSKTGEGLPQGSLEMEATASQLHGKTSDELVKLVLEMQSSHRRQLATLSAQYEEVSQQLLGIKKCLSTLLRGQSSAVEAAAALLTPIDHVRAGPDPHPHRSATSNVPDFVRVPTSSRSPSIHPHMQHSPASPISNPANLVPVTQTPRGAGSVVPSASLDSTQYHQQVATQPTQAAATAYTPLQASQLGQATPAQVPAPTPASTFQTPISASQPTPRRDSVASASSPTDASGSSMGVKFQVIPNKEEGKPPQVIYGSANSVADVWREYRYGIGGQPSIESLDATWGPRWRPEPKGRTWYSRRKIIWDKMKELIYDGLTEEAAIVELERLRAGRSMNWLMNILQNDRKEVKASWKAAAAAATAAKKEGSEAPGSTVFTAGVIRNFYA